MYSGLPTSCRQAPADAHAFRIGARLVLPVRYLLLDQQDSGVAVIPPLFTHSGTVQGSSSRWLSCSFTVAWYTCECLVRNSCGFGWVRPLLPIESWIFFGDGVIELISVNPLTGWRNICQRTLLRYSLAVMVALCHYLQNLNDFEILLGTSWFYYKIIT